MPATPTIDSIRLRRGAHRSREEGLSVTEAIAYVAGEEHSDRPACLSPVLGAFLSTWSDALDDETRQRLLPYVPRAIGTANDGRDERRGWLALDWLVRVHAPAWLELVSVAVLVEHARTLRALPELRDEASLEGASGEIAAAGSAAEAAGRVNREGVVAARPRTASGDAAGAAARAAGGVVAGAAANSNVLVHRAVVAASSESVLKASSLAYGPKFSPGGRWPPVGAAATAAARTAAAVVAVIVAAIVAGAAAGVVAGVVAGAVAAVVAGAVAGAGVWVVARTGVCITVGAGDVAARAAGLAAGSAAGSVAWVAGAGGSLLVAGLVYTGTAVVAATVATFPANQAAFRAAARAELEPAARERQESAFELLDRLIDPAAL